MRHNLNKTIVYENASHYLLIDVLGSTIFSWAVFDSFGWW